MGDPRNKCEDCQRLEEEQGTGNLNICPRCDHYFEGEECSCGGEQ